MIKKKILCLIPARGGSSGIKNKNLIKFHSKPLIYWSINLAKKIDIFDNIIVSTDSKRIRKIALKIGAEVPFLRPKKISTSNTSMKEVINHCILYFKKKKIIFDAIVLFQPTSPFRKKKTIEKAIKIFFKKKLDTLFSIQKIKHTFNPYYTFELKKNLKNRIKKLNHKPIRQKEKQFYALDGGAVFIFKSTSIINNIFGNKIGFIEVDKFESIDIDDYDDYKLYKNIPFN